MSLKFKLFLKLPEEVMVEILLKLSIVEILSVVQTSRRLKSLSSDPIFWKELVRRDFGVKYRVEDTWREEYLYLFRRDANRWLIKAAQDNNLGLVKYALFRGAKIYAIASRESYDYDAMMIAAERGNLEIVEFLDNFVKDKCLQPNYEKILEITIRDGSIETIKFLIDRIENYRVLCHAVSIAAQKGRIDIIEEMEYIHNRDPDRERLFHEAVVEGAVSGGHQEFLLKSLEYLDKHQMYCCSNLVYRALKGGNHQLAIYLFERFPTKFYDYKYLGLCAIEGGNIESLDLVLKITKDPINYEYLIEKAIELGNLEIFKFLVNKGGNENILNRYNLFLKMAVEKGYLDIIEHLLLQNSITLVNFEKILVSAVSISNFEIIKILLNYSNSRDININYDNLIGLTIDKRDITIMEFLLDEMERKNLQPDYGHYLEKVVSKETAFSNMSTFLLNRLKKKKISIEMIHYHNSLLLLIIERGDLKLYNYLIDLIEKKSLKIDYHKQFDEAVSNREIEIIELLLRRGIKFDYQRGLFLACRNGKSSSIARLMLDLLKKDNIQPQYDSLFPNLVNNGSEDLFFEILHLAQKEEVKIDYSGIIFHAVYKGNLRIISELKDHIPVSDYQGSLIRSIKSDYCPLVRFLLRLIMNAGFDLDHNKIKEVIETKEKDAKHSYFYIKDYSHMREILGI